MRINKKDCIYIFKKALNNLMHCFRINVYITDFNKEQRDMCLF